MKIGNLIEGIIIGKLVSITEDDIGKVYIVEGADGFTSRLRNPKEIREVKNGDVFRN